jgi:hypothetical protein
MLPFEDLKNLVDEPVQPSEEQQCNDPKYEGQEMRIHHLGLIERYRIVA